MKFGIAMCGAFVAGAALALVAAAPWQDAKAKDKAAGGDTGMSAEDMAMWTKLATPGPEHAEMAQFDVVRLEGAVGRGAGVAVGEHELPADGPGERVGFHGHIMADDRSSEFR